MKKFVLLGMLAALVTGCATQGTATKTTPANQTLTLEEALQKSAETRQKLQEAKESYQAAREASAAAEQSASVTEAVKKQVNTSKAQVNAEVQAWKDTLK